MPIPAAWAAAERQLVLGRILCNGGCLEARLFEELGAAAAWPKKSRQEMIFLSLVGPTNYRYLGARAREDLEPLDETGKGAEGVGPPASRQT